MLFKHTQKRINKALDEAFSRAEKHPLAPRSLDTTTAKIVIFSDLHKGIRNRADDFRHSETAYNAAMKYYLDRGYTLIALGDVEELWEERAGPVLEKYKDTFSLEAQFHQLGHYFRVWGNHDDQWRYGDQVKKMLAPAYGGANLRVREGIRFQVLDGGEPIGTLFLVHGHQGTLDSDVFPSVSRFFVRNAWRPIQRITGFSPNTPAKDWKLAQGQNERLYRWSEQQDDLVLIAGHTHSPIFRSLYDETKMHDEMTALEKEIVAAPAERGLQKELRQRADQLAFVQERGRQVAEPLEATRVTRPSYFNTGCCCFTDGEITGLEIADGEIRLVRWSADESQPILEVLDKASLKSVFAELKRQG
jgi:UDP-2,3-diacylglucosamine pyrophosphatase LpxH